MSLLAERRGETSRHNDTLICAGALLTMARASSPTASEGFGFTYADKVGALALLAVLNRGAFAEMEAGVVTSVHFGQRPAGWLFDDLILTTDSLGTERHIAISIKSDSQVSNAGLPATFTQIVWEQLDKPGPFVEGLDLLALAQPSSSPVTRSELEELTRWAMTQKDGQTEEWMQEYVANDIKRAFFESGRAGDTKRDAVRFFRNFRVLYFDVVAPSDQSVRDAQSRLMEALAEPSEQEAVRLWESLCQLAADTRGSAGHVNLARLLDHTRAFSFRAHPRVASDLAKIKEFSNGHHLATVKDTIGNDLRIPTDGATKQLEQAIEEAPITFFLAPSGTGKSVAFKNFVTKAEPGHAKFYFRADYGTVSPTGLKARLGLQHDLAVCLSESRSVRTTLVIDQVDRLAKDEDLSNVLELLFATKEMRASLRVVFGCQNAEAERVISRLAQVLEPSEVKQVIFAPDEDALFARVIKRYPTLKGIAFRRELKSIFLRAKHIDLLVGRLGQIGKLTSGEITSQKLFIDWFWSEYVEGEGRGIAGSFAMRKLAEDQADNLNYKLDHRAVTDLTILDSLKRSGLIVGDDVSITFQHDLYGDWSRLRTIEGNRENLVAFLETRGRNPLWLRSLRLWSAVFLETEGATQWHQVLSQFSEERGHVAVLVRDAMLDGLGLAVGSVQYLEELAAILFEDDGKLLNKFLSRFLFAATVPDEASSRAYAGADLASLQAFRSAIRIPLWYLWPPVVQFLTTHRSESRELAPRLTTEILRHWLSDLPANAAYSKQSSELALDIFEDYLETHSSKRPYGHESHQDFGLFRCAFLGLQHNPSRATELIRRGIGRTGPDPFPDAEAINGSRFEPRRSNIMPTRSRIVEAWPDGPVARPDDNFRKFVLMGGGIRESYSFSPDFSKEVALAALILEPHLEPDHGLHFEADVQLSIANERSLTGKSFYDVGLFGMIWDIDFAWALSLVLKITDFAVQRECELADRHGVPSSFELTIGGESRNIRGTSRGYGWHRDDMGCPDLVVCALMSLERQMYKRLDSNPTDPVVSEIIRSANNLAILGLLASVGKKFNSLFQDALHFLHFSETIQWLDLDQVNRHEGHQLIAWTGSSEREVKRAQEWHLMPHRKTFLKKYAILALTTPEGREEALQACTRWNALAQQADDADTRAGFDSLVATYSIENYSCREVDQGLQIECTLPADVQQRADDLNSAQQDRVRPMILALQCRMVLDGEKELGACDIEEWVTVARNLQGDYSGNIAAPFSPADAICGVAAALILRFPEKLDADPELKAWAADSLTTACLNPPPQWQMDSEFSVSKEQWVHFAAEALPTLLKWDPSNRNLRAALAVAIEDAHYNVSSILARSLFPLFHENHALYRESISLFRACAMERIRVRELERKAQYPEYVPISETWPDYNGVRQAFIGISSQNTMRPTTGALEEFFGFKHHGGATAAMSGPLPRPVPIQRDEDEHGYVGYRDRDRARPMVDTTRLIYFVVNLPWNPLPMEDSEATVEITERWQEVFDELYLEIWNDGSLDNGEVPWYHTEWEVFGHFGWFAAAHPNRELTQEWATKMASLRKIADVHLERYVGGAIRQLLSADDPTPYAVESWLILIEAMLGTRSPTTDDWRRNGVRDKCTQLLVGNDALVSKYSWKASHAKFVAEHRDLFEPWCRAVCRPSRYDYQFLYLLSGPAFTSILGDSCTWIGEELKRLGTTTVDDGFGDALASYLVHVRKIIPAIRRARPDVLNSYLDLVSLLNVNNNRLAMQLFEDAATLG